MSPLSDKNRTLLLYALLLGGMSIPHLPLLVRAADPNLGTTLLKEATPTISGSSSIATSSSQGTTQAPIIQGWGGVTLDEASNGQLQSTLLRLNQSGYNGVRIGFSRSVTQCSAGELGSWNPDWFNQTLKSAHQYGMWVILDYHSYVDLVSSVCQTEWLYFWNGVLTTNWG